MNYKEVFDAARRRPGMLGLDGSYVAASAFIAGCDAGNAWRLLDGFKEWLASELGEGRNLTWQALVLRHSLVGGSDQGLSRLSQGEADVVAVETLFRLLEEFWTARDASGLGWIFARYESIFEDRDG